MTSTNQSSSMDQLEWRLSDLELKLGVLSHASSGAPSTPSPNVHSATSAATTDADAISVIHGDVNSRLDRLLRLAATSQQPTLNVSSKTLTSSSKVKSIDSKKRSALHQEFIAIDRLLSELAISPISGPTALALTGSSGGASGAATDALVLRRMEILASSESMKRDLEILAKIRDLTLLGNKEMTKSGSGSSKKEDGSKFVNCPIVTSDRYNLPSDPEMQQRLERLCFRVANVHRRSLVVSERVDEIMTLYGKVMDALSEKISLAEEHIKRV